MDVKMMNYLLSLRISVNGKYTRIVSELNPEKHSEQGTKNKMAKFATEYLCKENNWNTETIKDFNTKFLATVKKLKKEIWDSPVTANFNDDEIIKIDPSNKRKRKTVTLNIRLSDLSLKQIEASIYKTKVKEFEKYCLYVYKDERAVWTITEAITGMKIVDSLDTKSGLEDRLKMFVDKIEIIDKKIKEIYSQYGNVNPHLI